MKKNDKTHRHLGIEYDYLFSEINSLKMYNIIEQLDVHDGILVEMFHAIACSPLLRSLDDLKEELP